MRPAPPEFPDDPAETRLRSASPRHAADPVSPDARPSTADGVPVFDPPSPPDLTWNPESTGAFAMPSLAPQTLGASLHLPHPQDEADAEEARVVARARTGSITLPTRERTPSDAPDRPARTRPARSIRLGPPRPTRTSPVSSAVVSSTS
jgi:hypothetical protein